MVNTQDGGKVLKLSISRLKIDQHETFCSQQYKTVLDQLV